MSAILSTVIPAYNEEAGLASVVAGLQRSLRECGVPYEILVVDDGSKDRTLEVARSLPGIRVLRHEVNRGYGAALKTGIRAARGEYILICDADGTYPPESIPGLVAQMSGRDMVVAARTGDSVAIPFTRRFAKGILRRLAIYLSESPIPDLNSGLRIFRRDAALRYFPILPSGFSFTTTITLSLLCNEGVVSWLPINYSKRTGRSKIRPFYDTLNFLILIMRTILYFNPLRIFLPVSLVIGLLFLVSLGWDLFVLKDLTEKTLILMVGAMQMVAVGVIADLITRRLQPPEPAPDDRGDA